MEKTMTYFLDFDRTLFDTDSFKEYLYTRPSMAALADMSEMELAHILNKQVSEGVLTFAAGELMPFVYPEVREFLQTHHNDAVIVTYGNAALQKAKVENALGGIMLRETHYTGDMRKGEYMQPRIKEYAGALVFADDTPHELALMNERCPEVVCYEMRRDGGAGDGRWPVIRSLSELP